MASKTVKIENSAATPAPQPEALTNADKVKGYIKQWSDYREKLLKNWERDTKLYNNERFMKKFQGVADTFIGMSFSTVEDITGALSNGDLNTDFVPQDIYKYLKDNLMQGHDPEVEEEEDYLTRALANAIHGGVITDENLEVLNALYDYWWDCGDWDLAVEQMIRGGLQIGNGSLWMTWKDGKPQLEVVAFPDYVFDPLAKSDKTYRFAGKRYLASLSELRIEEIIDPMTGKPKKRYDLSKVTTDVKRDTNSKTDKELKEKLLFGSTVFKANTGNAKQDEETDQVEVIEIMDNERMYTMVNREFLIEDEENFIITQAKLKGMDLRKLILIPGITWSNYKDPSLLIGKSEISTFWQEQERLNDSTNQKSDAVTRALLQNYRADISLKPQANSFSVPGAVIWSSQGQYEAIPPAQVPGVAFNEELSIKNNIRETSATQQVASGIGTSKDTTATEASIQSASSDDRTLTKIKSLTRGPLKRIALLALQYEQLFIEDPFIVPKKVNNGIQPLLFNPKKYQYDIEPKVTLNIATKEKWSQERKEAIDTYELLIADPTNNIQEVKKIMLPKIVNVDPDEIERMTTPAPQPTAMPGMLPNYPATMPNAGMPTSPQQQPSSAPLIPGLPQ